MSMPPPRRMHARLQGRRIAPALVVVLLLCCAASASAQFRNNGLQLPNVGWMAMGTSSDWLNKSYGVPWGATDQLTLGVGYFRAVGYDLWLENQVALGFGGAVNEGAFPKTVVGLNASLGLRYNFLDEKHRPFVAAHIHYTQLFNTEGTEVPKNAALGQPLWVGGRVGAGYEWFFAEEMSLQGELGGILFFNLDHPPKLSALARLSYNVYF